eukprot:634869-Rhodomonas_salina.2
MHLRAHYQLPAACARRRAFSDIDLDDVVCVTVQGGDGEDEVGQGKYHARAAGAERRRGDEARAIADPELQDAPPAALRLDCAVAQQQRGGEADGRPDEAARHLVHERVVEGRSRSARRQPRPLLHIVDIVHVLGEVRARRQACGREREVDGELIVRRGVVVTRAHHQLQLRPDMHVQRRWRVEVLTLRAQQRRRRVDGGQDVGLADDVEADGEDGSELVVGAAELERDVGGAVSRRTHGQVVPDHVAVDIRQTVQRALELRPEGIPDRRELVLGTGDADGDRDARGG